MNKPSSFQLLKSLIAPLPVEDFLEQYFEQKHLLLQNKGRSNFDEFLTIKDLDDLLQIGILPPQAVKLVKTNYLSFNEWTSLEKQAHQVKVDIQRIFSHLQKGHSLSLIAVNRFLPKLQRWIEAFQVEMLSNARANVYITPPKAQAFARHYDTHDVFVLQIAGTKHWKVYDQITALPDETMKYNNSTIHLDNAIPKAEFTLQKGDLLYIPRGMAHEALTTNTTSIHISIGLNTLMVKHLVTHMSKIVANQVFFRKSILNFDDELLKKDLKEKLIAFVDNADINDLLEETTLQFLKSSHQNHRSNGLQQFLQQSTISEDTVVSKRIDGIYELKKVGRFIIVQFNHHQLKLPFFLEDVLESIFHQETIIVKDIKGNIKTTDKIKIVQQLVNKGLIIVNDSTQH